MANRPKKNDLSMVDDIVEIGNIHSILQLMQPKCDLISVSKTGELPPLF